MENLTIRPYTPTDQEALLQLLQLNTPRYFAPEEEPDFLQYLQHETEEYFVLERQGRVVGCGGVNFSEDGQTGKISWDILHPDFQGQGLGRALLTYRIARLLEVHQVTHITVRTSQVVYRFYEKNGFQLVEVVKDYWAPGFDLYRMEYVDKI
ncbi:GNAT family acetyltransferase [Rufibacter sp. DG15C]|uniref:GNAT family N-acetyltransferase n=1 Tax=Rufibacter sp. DG15C TaxID=1379909 RepID=UPI00078D1909|nr:GNAT family N-acetyltransferase [Rufibacter sp. DG15C]AMM52505.1 GNAT family acetyltransferase [Rufibacter sp. DG15C]